ncbi:hypothetical protein GCM10009765_69960 [Fodinicola feengrottensis]|uniref:DUF3291 domain-containing protein n=1 Tax=Fodinicola feengrottensis TaxID=435914 RepID=A0ABN2IS57_9ACTN
MSNHERVSDKRGQVVITRFACPSLSGLFRLMVLHIHIKRQVRRQAPGFVGGKAVILWRQRTMLSITLWRHLDDIYDMGKVNAHIMAARVPARLGIQTSCGIYSYSGDWRAIMFGTPATSADPLVAAAPSPTAGVAGADLERKTS